MVVQARRAKWPNPAPIFYEKIRTLFSGLKMPCLSQEEARNMTTQIEEQEIKKLKNNKSPGTGGIPGEVYKCFENELSPILARVYNYALAEGNPPRSWAEAIISYL